MCAAGGVGACYSSVWCVGDFYQMVPKPVQRAAGEKMPLQILVADGTVGFLTTFIIQSGCVGSKTWLKIV